MHWWSSKKAGHLDLRVFLSCMFLRDPNLGFYWRLITWEPLAYLALKF